MMIFVMVLENISNNFIKKKIDNLFAVKEKKEIILMCRSVKKCILSRVPKRLLIYLLNFLN